MAKEQLKDVFKKTVNEGNEVVVLVKDYGYRKLTDAYLSHAVYIGRGRYGYEFVDQSDYHDFQISAHPEEMVYRLRDPECVKIQTEVSRSIEQLNQKIYKYFGERITSYRPSNIPGEYVFIIPEGYEDDVRDIIIDAGYDIVDEKTACDSDDTQFTIKLRRN